MKSRLATGQIIFEPYIKSISSLYKPLVYYFTVYVSLGRSANFKFSKGPSKFVKNEGDLKNLKNFNHN